MALHFCLGWDFFSVKKTFCLYAVPPHLWRESSFSFFIVQKMSTTWQCTNIISCFGASHALRMWTLFRWRVSSGKLTMVKWTCTCAIFLCAMLRDLTLMTTVTVLILFIPSSVTMVSLSRTRYLQLIDHLQYDYVVHYRWHMDKMFNKNVFCSRVSWHLMFCWITITSRPDTV